MRHGDQGGGGQDEASRERQRGGGRHACGPAAEAKAKAKAAEDETEPRDGTSGRAGLDRGVVRTTGARIDWASLMKRVFREDVLETQTMKSR